MTDYKKSKRWGELMKSVQAAAQEVGVAEAEMRANNGPAQRCDLLLFPLSVTGENFFGHFGIVNQHPDNEGDLCNPRPDDLFFVVPVDSETFLVGPCDVVGETKHFGQAVARCGLGQWLSRNDIDALLGTPIDNMGRSEMTEEFRLACSRMMAAMLRLDLPEESDEDNPGYQAWMKIVGEAVYRIERIVEGL